MNYTTWNLSGYSNGYTGAAPGAGSAPPASPANPWGAGSAYQTWGSAGIGAPAAASALLAPSRSPWAANSWASPVQPPSNGQLPPVIVQAINRMAASGTTGNAPRPDPGAAGPGPAWGAGSGTVSGHTVRPVAAQGVPGMDAWYGQAVPFGGQAGAFSWGAGFQ